VDLDRFRFYGLHTLLRKVLGIGKHHVLATHKRSRWKVWNFSAEGQKESNRQCSRFQQRVFSSGKLLYLFTLTWKTLFRIWVSSLHFSRDPGVHLSMSVRTASDPSKAQGFSLHSLWAGFLVIFVVVFPSNFMGNSVLHSCPQGCPFHSAGTPSRIRSPSFPWKSRGLSGLIFCLSPRFIKREQEGLSTGVIPRKEIVPSILEFVVKLTFIHLSWTGAGKRRCLEQEMEAWVEEAVNENGIFGFVWFWFSFFCCERSESKIRKQMTIEVGVCLREARVS